MAPGVHNVSSATQFRLASCQVSALQSEHVGAARFWAKVRVAGQDECWLWQAGFFPCGYGQIWWGGRPEGAHRVARELSHGPIPEGQHVLHACDTKACCNPLHLSLGQWLENNRQASERGLLEVPRPSLHKVSTEQLQVIDALLASRVPQKDIARQFGVSKAWMSLYARGKRRQYDRPAMRRSA